MIIFLTVLLLQMKDTAAEADGDRNLRNQKFHGGGETVLHGAWDFLS